MFTDWFNAIKEPPVKAGWYHARYEGDEKIYWRFWTGEKWEAPLDPECDDLVANFPTPPNHAGRETMFADLEYPGDEWRGMIDPQHKE